MFFLKYKDLEGKDVSRPYTPVSSDEEKGYMDLVIKVYPEGKMSQHLLKLQVGGTIEMRGPQGRLAYHGNGEFVIRRKSAVTKRDEDVRSTVRRLGMIAGGTGITPMLQLIRAILRDQKDPTHLSLIFANVSEADILLKEELDRLHTAYPQRFALFYTLDKADPKWQGGVGFVTADMIQKHLPEPAKDSLLLMCGPPPMMNFMLRNMKTLDYQEDHYFQY